KDANGEIYISELEGYTWSAPVRLDSNINTPDWEGSVSLSADGTTLYFASEKPGGQGGRDIYVSSKIDDSTWAEAVNLGPVINTPYHDEAPFIHPDGKSLYFSSQGHGNMGGYDIFLSTLQEDGTWPVPENLGYPINTTDDDKYYVVSADGERGYYSSEKSGGYGQYDIYVVYLGEYAKEHELILIKGRVTVNDEVAEAEIYAEYVDNNEPYEGYFKSNSATGKYIVILPAESNYNLSYEVEGFPMHIENVNASDITTYIEIVRDIRLYSDDYVRKLNISGTILAQNGEKAVNVTILIASEDGSLSMQAVTDEMGYFSFDQLPGDKNYMFSMTQDMNAIISGRVLVGEEPKEGVLINKIMTEKDGVFNMQFTAAPEVTAVIEEEAVTEEKEMEDVIIVEKTQPADLTYRVQVAACGHGENYNTDHLADLGKIESVSIQGIRRLTIGGIFQSLEQAAAFKQKVIQLGTKDAFITAVENSNRKYLFEIHGKYPDISRQADELGLNEVIVPTQ
ncbi:PD40 domain-containing protein, partial [bacterium AH-315-M05]|nr:PD40 domain-containing protein [bacterium AH-315-M05]